MEGMAEICLYRIESSFDKAFVERNVLKAVNKQLGAVNIRVEYRCIY